jgi:hypothetical protein
MHQSGGEDPKFREVRAVLHRLQRLPDEPQSAGSGPADSGFRRGYLVGIAGTVTVITAAAVVLAFGFAVPGLRPQTTSAPKGVPDLQLASSTVPEVSGIPAGSVVSSKARPASSPTVRPPAVEAAQALMSTGRVQAARQQLLAIALDGSPDVAWALARSYDPNHLKGVQGADAGPDVAEATRWYRTWYAAAVKQGMITDSISLEKIVGSMRP